LLHCEVMISNCENGYSIFEVFLYVPRKLLLSLSLRCLVSLGKKSPEQVALHQDDRILGMMKCQIMSPYLAQHCTYVEVCVCLLSHLWQSLLNVQRLLQVL
jgi:hypothetical protein